MHLLHKGMTWLFVNTRRAATIQRYKLVTINLPKHPPPPKKTLILSTLCNVLLNRQSEKIHFLNLMPLNQIRYLIIGVNS